MRSYKSILANQQSPKVDRPQNRPEGTVLCIECRRDTPRDEVHKVNGNTSGQLCPMCYRRRNERIEQHAQRIRSELE